MSFDVTQTSATAQPIGLQAAAPPTDPVQTAVDRINDALSESATDWDVGHGDLMEARDALNGLTPQQVDQVVGRLSDDTLRHWNGEMNGIRGALSADEKRDQFNFLAQNLGPDQLARVSQQFRYGADEQQFATAVGRFRDGATVGAFADRLLSAPPRENATRWTDNAALAALAIGQADGRGKFQAAFGQMDAGQRARMLNETDWTPKGVEPTAFNGLTTAIARYGTLEQRTEAFTTISQSNAKFRDDMGKFPFSPQDVPALDAPYAAMTRLFATDPRGMTELMSSQERGMGPLTDFLEVAVIKGDFREIGQWGLAVRQGQPIPGDDQSASARFAYDYNRDPNGSDYRNAGVSGAFSGAAMAAALNVNIDAGKRQDLAMSLITGGLSTAASALPVAGQVAVGAGSTIGQPIVKAMLDNAGQGRQDFFKAIGDAGIPRGPNDALPPIGSGERVAFDAAVGEVLDAHDYR